MSAPDALAWLSQMLIFATGLTAVLALQFGSARARRWAPVIGIAGQPAWLWHAWQSGAVGVGIVSLAYTAVWAAGCVGAWRSSGASSEGDSQMKQPNAASALALQQRLADRAVICDIECEANAERDAAGRLWYDVRPMLDEREHSPELIDMAREAIDYALARGLIERHAQMQHMVRIAQRQQ